LRTFHKVNSHCLNTIASYECVCNDGYKWGNAQCLDIDECYNSDHGCSDNSLCANTDGSYECTCVDGYEATTVVGGTGLAKGSVGCADIDECIDDNNNDCNEHADCINTPGSYSCECRDGFHGTGFDSSWGCFNINECDVGRTDCDPNAQCIDIVGEKGISGLYRCECNLGYHGPGETCFDDDECSLGTHTCDLTKSYCVNVEMPNRFLCECKTGYLRLVFSVAFKYQILFRLGLSSRNLLEFENILQ